MKKILILAIMLVMMTSIIGCGKISIKTDQGTINLDGKGIEVQDENGQKTSIGTDGDKVVIKGNDGTTELSSEGNSLPDDFPKDVVPVIGHAEIMDASRMASNDGKLFMLTLHKKTDIEKVRDFYKEVLDGATETSRMNMEGMSIYSGTKGGYGITILIEYIDEENKDEGVNIQITAQSK